MKAVNKQLSDKAMEKKMRKVSLPLGAISNQAKHIDNALHKNQSWWNFTAFLCLAGGVSFGIIGLFLSGIGYFVGADGVDSNIGTILVFAAFPLMLFGASALDKVSENVKKGK